MGIENLLAQGVQIRPAGMERNALMQAQQFQDAKQRNALLQMQMDDVHAQRQLAIEQAKQVAADRKRVEQFRQSIPSPQMQASQQALAGGGGPTVGNAAQIRPVDPRLQALHGAMQAGMGTPMDYMKELHPEQKLQAVGMDQNIVDMNRGAAVVRPGQAKPAALPPGMQMGTNGPEWIPGYLEGKGKVAAQGASRLSVNTGQKGYENESKLRNDFKSEPIYKDFQDMDQAYKQIKAGLSAKTPIGDVAAATKIMKLLDPGSVVRESELAIAMAAAGKLDRLQNYVQMKISGESLTPKQRVDFEALAGELHGAASQAYNAKRMEYENTGKRYGLDPTVLGPPSAMVPRPLKPAGKPAASGWTVEAVKD